MSQYITYIQKYDTKLCKPKELQEIKPDWYTKSKQKLTQAYITKLVSLSRNTYSYILNKKLLMNKSSCATCSCP